MKYNNSDKDLKVKMFYLTRSEPKYLEEEINNFLSDNSINIIDIMDFTNKSVRWLTIYYTEFKNNLDGVI